MRSSPLHAALSTVFLLVSLCWSGTASAAETGGATAYSTTTMLAGVCALAGEPGAEYECDGTDLIFPSTYNNTLTKSATGMGTSATSTSPITYTAATQGEAVYPATLDSLTTNVSMNGSAVKQPPDEFGNAGYGAEATAGGHTTTYFQVTGGSVPYSITHTLTPDADDCTRLSIELKGAFNGGGQEMVYRRSANTTSNCTQTQPAPQADVGAATGQLAPGWYDLEVRWSVSAPTVPWLPDRSISATVASKLTFTTTTPPGLRINNASVSEGNSELTPMVFDLSLPAPATEPVSVDVTTVDATAAAGDDYGSVSETIEFDFGEQTQQLTVGIAGDRRREPNETFTVLLSDPAGATISDGTGTGTIVNDDTCDNEFTASADVIIGTSGPDVLCGGAGADRIRGVAGNDRIIGGEGNDELYGGAGRDFISDSGGTNGIEGGFGNDTIVGGDGFEGVQGGPGADTIKGGGDADILIGGDGNDTIYGQEGGDNLFGAGGQDVLEGGGHHDELQGGGDTDTLSGDGGDDLVEGGGGADRVNGGTGDDGIDGNEGQDVVLAGAGNDVATGGPANDELRGGGGADWLMGRGGDDTITGGAGEGDDIDGGDGDDRLRACNGGHDEVRGGPDDDVARLEHNDTAFEVEEENAC